METQQETSKTLGIQQPGTSDIETTAPGKLRVIYPTAPFITIIWWVTQKIGPINRDFLFETSVINKSIGPQNLSQ